jgi:hypothetical protein
MIGYGILVALVLAAPAPKTPKPHPIVGTWLILTHTQDGRTWEIKGEHCWTFTADGRRGIRHKSGLPIGFPMPSMRNSNRPGLTSLMTTCRPVRSSTLSSRSMGTL